jgi:hypothetical protein
MTSDYKLCNIVDSQLEDITSELALPVVSGSTSNTFQQFNAQGGTSSTSMQFQIQIPSMATAVNRHVLAQTDLDLQIDLAGGTTVGYWAADQVLFAYGKTNALQAFPLNALITTVQAQINNSNVTVSTRDVLSALLKMYNYEELAKYNSLTPSLIDSFYQDYSDGLGSNNNVLANYSVGTFSKEYQPRGCFPVKLFQMDGTTEINALTVKADADGTAPFASFIMRFTTCEPLLFLSPFISGLSKSHASFLGLNTLNLTLNLGDATRVMSNASYATHGGVSTKTISNVTFLKGNASKLLMNFLDIPPQIMAKVEPKNVVNYNQYMSYNYSTSQTIQPGDTAQLTFNNVQLGSIPSKILIYAKKPNLTTYDSNFFMPITQSTFNFANRSGVLSSATQVDLYNMSVKNGLQMNFYEFSGSGVSNDVTGNPVLVPTTGGILVVDPAIDLSIASEYTNMSKGQFNMQFSITVKNQTKEAITPTMYMICVNSGVFITERGTSRFDIGLLDKEAVLQAKNQVAVMDKDSYEDSVVGGSIENLGCIHKHMKLNFHRASEKEDHLDNAPGEYVPDNAGAMSAGSMPKRRIHKYAK